MKNINDLNPMLLTDFYKTIHHLAYVPKLEYLVSYWTPRKSRYEGVNEVVVFGLQGFLKEFFVDQFNDNFFNRDWNDIELEYKRIISNTMNIQASDTTELKKLYDIGYLPIRVKALPEGTISKIKTPIYEFSNTISGFGWLVNALETYISVNVWHPINSATVGHEYRKIVNKYFDKTVSNVASFEVKDGNVIALDKKNNIILNDNRASACGDFSMRGMTDIRSAAKSSAAHLLSFSGTATISAIPWLENYYNCDCEKEIVGKGVPSTEHSVMSSYGRENEYECYRHLIEDVFPNGPLSIVSDTYDYWNVVTNFLPKLKNSICNRNGKIVIRGDSGNPVDIICGTDTEIYEDMGNISIEEAKNLLVKKANADCKWRDFGCNDFKYRVIIGGKKYIVTCEAEDGCNNNDEMYVNYYVFNMVVNEVCTTPEEKGTVELLWDIFGGYINDKGYKVLEPHIGAIYGDAITIERAKEIYEKLECKGFAVNNVTLGIGSFTYQYVTRDSLGQALKATNAIVDDEEMPIYKDPKTDKSAGNNFKKSQKGMCYVYRNEDGEIVYTDEHSFDDMKSDKYADNMLETVFEDGKITKEETLSEIRNRLNKNKF